MERESMENQESAACGWTKAKVRMKTSKIVQLLSCWQAANETNSVHDVNVELMLGYGSWPDALGEQRTCSKPAVDTQSTHTAAGTTHCVPSTQWLASTITLWRELLVNITCYICWQSTSITTMFKCHFICSHFYYNAFTTAYSMDLKTVSLVWVYGCNTNINSTFIYWCMSSIYE